MKRIFFKERQRRQVMLAAAVLAAGAFAGTVTTSHSFVAADGAFHEAANWDPAEVPSGNANAVVTNGTIRISQDASLATLGIGTRGCADGVQTGGVLSLTGTTGPDSVFSLAGYQDGAANANVPMVSTYTISGGILFATKGYMHVGQREADKASEGILHVTGGAVTTCTWTAIGRFGNSRAMCSSRTRAPSRSPETDLTWASSAAGC